MQDLTRTLIGLSFAIIIRSAIAGEELAPPPVSNWPIVGGNWSNARYSALTEINTRNIEHLGAAWVSDAFDEGSTSNVTPTVKDGMMFVTAGRRVYALDARTGRTIWNYKTNGESRIENGRSAKDKQPQTLSPLNTVPNSRGVAVGGGLVFVGMMDGHVIALKEKSGDLAWIQQTGVDERKNWQISSPAPTFVNNLVLTGLSSGDANLRGRVTALEASTGKKLWELFTIPGPGEPGHETWPRPNGAWKVGGGGVWTNAAVDARLGLAYVTTGNPVPGFAGDWRPGDNLFTCSVLAIDITTGKIKWHYQLVHHDVFEADAGTPVVLYDLIVNQQIRNALGVLRADGYLFQLDRQTGEPILPIQERPVPQLKSQDTSPTQPFPAQGESILMSCDDWRRKGVLPGFVLSCMWTPPSSPPPSGDPQNVLAPFPSARVTPMAYSPQTGYLYAQSTSYLSWPRRSQDPYYLGFSYNIVTQQAYSELAAIDSRTGRIAWKKQVHTSQGPQYWRGAALATAGGLVFRSAGDGNIEAYSAKTGHLLWTFQTGIIDGRGSPVSYEIDGDQYIAVPVGSNVWAFKIGGRMREAPAPPALPPREQFSGPIEETDKIETTFIDLQLLWSAGTRYFVDEFSFKPYRTRVKAGTKVLFVNNGSMRHEVMALDGSWGTGPLVPTEEAWITFDKVGEYTYVCKDHPWTYGQIIVIPNIENEQITGNVAGSQSDEQNPINKALRGKKQFTSSCSPCHGENLAGLGLAPALSGASFISRWGNAAASDLLYKIKTTMPPQNPGGLDNDTYVNILLYLQRANNLTPQVPNGRK